MANEIKTVYQTGKTAYFLVRNSTGYIWNTSTSAFETYTVSNYTNYAIEMLEQSSSGFYLGNFPLSIPSGTYNIVVLNQYGMNPSQTDSYIGSGNFNWNGYTEVNINDLCTAFQFEQLAPIRISYGTMVNNFPIYFVSAADGISDFVSGIVSGSIARDGSSVFNPLNSGSFTEIGRGWYNLQALTSSDLLCNTAAIEFTCTGISGGSAIKRAFSLILQRTSGQ